MDQIEIDFEFTESEQKEILNKMVLLQIFDLEYYLQNFDRFENYTGSDPYILQRKIGFKKTKKKICFLKSIQNRLTIKEK